MATAATTRDSYMHSTSTTTTMNSSSSASNETEPVDLWDYSWNFPFSVILAAILSVSAFLAVVGNSMVLTVVIRHRGMRTRTNLFLVNLAVADLLVGAAVMPFAITTLIEGRWVFGSGTGTFCSINGWLNCFCLVASIHTLMYISVHKYYSITKPLGSHFKLRQILGMMAAAWVWAAVSSTITVTGLSSVRYKAGTTQCGPEYPAGLKSYVFHAIIQVTNVFIPIIILTFCYTRMFREIRAHGKRMQANSTLEQDIILAQQKKVAITLFIVLVVFVVCVLPFHLYSTYATIKKDKHFSPYLNPVAYAFLYLNSACNPIIYAFRSPSFREGYKEILCQTPHYVISDDAVADGLHSPLRRRLSSLFGSLRRNSNASSAGGKDALRSSRTSLTSMGSQGSPNSVTSPGTRKKQRGMAGLIRASRRSMKESSIIRQNGDIIIVKGGKIVSIRRQPGWSRDGGLQDSSPFLQRAAKHNGTGANGHMPHAVLNPTDSRNSLEMSKVISQSKESVSSDGSDSVFDGSSNTAVPSRDSHLDMVSEEKRLLSDHSETDTSQINSPDANNIFRVSAAAAKDAHSKDSVVLDSSNTRTEVGIIISIDEDNSILDVMPLTPHTRDRITRSDLFLDIEARTPAPLMGGKPASSTQAQVFSSKHSLHRMLSLEYLDPPASLRRSRSAQNVQKASEPSRFLNLPASFARRLSFGRQADTQGDQV